MLAIAWRDSRTVDPTLTRVFGAFRIILIPQVEDIAAVDLVGLAVLQNVLHLTDIAPVAEVFGTLVGVSVLLEQFLVHSAGPGDLGVFEQFDVAQVQDPLELGRIPALAVFEEVLVVVDVDVGGVQAVLVFFQVGFGRVLGGGFFGLFLFGLLVFGSGDV